MPLTEVPFLALSAASLALFALARREASIPLLVGGAAVAALACTVRSAGIVLAVAAVFAPATRRLRIAVAALAAVGAVVVAASAPYALGIARWAERPGETAPAELSRFVRMVGGVAANIPVSHVDTGLPRLVATLLGPFVLGLVAWALWHRRRDLRPVDGFVVGTLAMVLVYPEEHPRFYLPVIPVLASYVVLA